MLQCEDCGALFEQALLCQEYFGEVHGRPLYCSTPCCPRCGGVPAQAEGAEDAN